MIIHELRLFPFAGLADLQVPFEKGLTVVLGPNEAGKTTIVNALKLALFVPTKYVKRVFDREIKPFMPLSGGDTIQTELKFSVGKDSYTLSKSWGERKESQITLPNGGLITDPSAVQEKLRELLILKEGTYNSILFAYQSGLGSTLMSIAEDSTPKNDLASTLRKAVFETDGVSIEHLGNMINEQYEVYFSRWDSDLRRPEDNRGIENPFKRGVGRVLTAFYEKERLRVRVERAVDYEKQMDELNAQIQTITDEIKALKDFVSANRQIVEDARTRVVLEVKIESVEGKEKELRSISKKWPATEQEIKSKKESLETLRQTSAALTEELSQAKEYESNKQKVDKFERAEKKKNELDEALNILSKMKSIAGKDYEALENLHKQIERLRTSLEAGKINLSVMANKQLKLLVKKDFEDEVAQTIKGGKTVDFSAGGEIQVQHTDWSMKIGSGEMEFGELNSKFERANKDYNKLLNKLGVADLSEAKEIHTAYKDQQEIIKNRKEQFAETLEGEEYKKLEKLAKKLPQKRELRDTTAIAVDLGTVEADIKQTEKHIRVKTTEIKDWEQKYESQDKLLDLLLEKREELKKGKKSLQELKPLPKPVKDPKKFIEEFETKDRNVKTKERDLYDLRIKRAELESGSQEETLEELEIQQREANSYFERIEKEADAISELSETFEEVRSSMDTKTLDPWLEELQSIVAPLTANRYEMVEMTEDDFGRALRTDGLEVPLEALSQGTKVGLGLALRLSMAEYFLGGMDGFLLMDDPLVDLDSERQHAASKVIQNFAEERQVILFTCHPGHADLLGGHVIQLND